MILDEIQMVSEVRTRYSGGLSIKGTVNKLGTSYNNSHLVLIDRESFEVVDKKNPNEDGTYEFKALNRKSFIVIATDISEQFNAVIQDMVVPK